MNKIKKLLTLEDLVQFCRTNSFHNFSAKNTGYQLAVQIPATLKFENNELYSKDMLFCTVRVCHTLLNRNNSFISESNMKKAMPSLKYRPLLAAIHQLDDGSYDFHSHDMMLDENGNTVYIESQIGTFTADEPYLEYDKDEDKTYVVARVAISEVYTMAADIIRAKGGTDVSCELAIEDMSYNADKNYLELNDFYFSGCACLGSETDGTKVEPGMKGANLTIEDFSVKNNSVCDVSQEKLIEALEKLNTTLSAFTINNNQESKEASEMSHFEELLEKYGVTAEQCEFEYEGLTDEELDVIFAEHFEGVETTEEVAEEATEECATEELAEEASEETAEDVPTEEFTEEMAEGAPIEEGTTESNFSAEDIVINFRLSHDDIRYGVQNLVSAMNGDVHYYVVNSVYDGYFYYEDWMSMDAFKQSYKVRKDVISLSGDPEPVYREFVTQAEKDELESMRKNYAVLKEFKEQYDAAQLKAEKDAIFESVEYSKIKESEEFKALIKEAEKYSIEELKVKADLIFAASAKKTFALDTEETERKHSVGINFNAKPNKKKVAYKGLFDE